MPRKRGFCYDKDQYSKDCLIEKIEGRRKRLGISQECLGQIIGITQQGYAYRVDSNKGNASFSFIELVKIFRELRLSDEEILVLMKQESG